MSNYLVRETANLFDPATGAWIGVKDANGNEQLVPSVAGMAALPTDLGAPFQALVSGGRLSPRSSGCNVSDAGMLSAGAGAFKGNTMWQQTLALPTGVDAVAIALYSDVSDVSTYTGVKVTVQTTTGASLQNPAGGSTFTAVTFGGASNPTFVAGSAADPVPIWSDTVPVVNRGPGINYLIVRVYYPAGVANGGGTFDANNAATGSRVAKLAALGGGALYGYTVADQTTNTSASILTTGSVLPIQVRASFRTRVPVVWQFGDSTRQGWFGAGVVAACERWALAKVLAGKPVAMCNNGYSGQSSVQYLARLKRMVSAGQRCDTLIWQITTPNETQNATIVAAQISRAQEAIQLAQAMGASIVLDGPFPMSVGAPGAGLIATVNAADAFGKAMVGPGVYYADYSALHQPGAFGQWVAAYNYNSDALHPNELAVDGPILTALSAQLSAATGL